MKKYVVHIVIAVVIVLLAITIGCLYFSDKKETTNNPVEITEPVETATPEPTIEPTPTVEPEPTEEPTPEPTPESTYPSFEELYGTQEEREAEYWQSLADRIGMTVEEAKAKYGEVSIDNPEDRAAIFLAENLGLTFEETKAMLANGGEIDSPYMSDRKGYKVGDTIPLDNGVTVAYQGEDIWKDISSNTEYKTTKELENGGLWFEPIGTQQASGNPDSPYISERNGYSVGDQTTIGMYTSVTYQGGDVWMTEDSREYTVIKDNGNGYIEFAPGLFAKEGEQPMSERVGYQPGDSILNHSLGYDFNRVYVGNDIWYDDNDPETKLIASLQKGELVFTTYNW